MYVENFTEYLTSNANERVSTERHTQIELGDGDTNKDEFRLRNFHLRKSQASVRGPNTL